MLDKNTSRLLIKKNILNTIISIKKPQKLVNCKLIKCGNYYQVYCFDDPYFITDKNYNNIEDNLIKFENYIENYEEKEKIKIEIKENIKKIDKKNLNRSKNNMIRLIKTNEDKFKSFMTLTFEDNISDLNYANKEFNKFVTKIKRTFSEFLYVAVPEFQKNGRVHFHLLSNIDYFVSLLVNENISTSKLYQKMNESQIEEFKIKNSEKELLKKYGKKELNNLKYCFREVNGKLENTKKSYNYKSKEYKIFKTIKYWNNGYSNIIPTDNINVVGYMAKYMIEDFDNRLFGRNRYLHSANLESPIIEYLNLENLEHLEYLENILNSTKERYISEYCDKFGNKIKFIELKE